MADRKILDENLELVRKLSSELLQKPPIPLGEKTNIPSTGGVYIFYKDPEHRIYVGKAKNLRRRIHIDHLSAEMRDSMSALRRTINQIHKIAFGEPMRSWITGNCKIAFIEIEDADVRSMVEAYLICCLRSPHLLNKS